MAKKPKPPHPIDERDAKWLAEATEFTTNMRVGGKNLHHRFNDIGSACVLAMLLEMQHPTKRTIVYGVTPDGHQVMVMRSRMREEIERAVGNFKIETKSR